MQATNPQLNLQAQQTKSAAIQPGTPILPGPYIPQPINLLTPDASVGRGRLVTAQIQRHAEPSAGDLGWEDETAEVTLPSHTKFAAPNGFVVWKGAVGVPATYPSLGTHRVMIREYEVFETDPEVSESIPSGTVGVAYARRRLVYADAFEL